MNKPGTNYHVLYYNGLGPGKLRRRERLAIRHLQKRGITVEHMAVDWYSGEPFGDLLARSAAAVKRRLAAHGRVILVGSSAGGSLAINVFGRLHNPNLAVITLCSRLNEQPLARWDTRSLARTAHLETGQQARAFHDSVHYCTDVTIPALTASGKLRTIVVQQWADFVVPRPTMSIPGVRVYRVPGLGHGWGIAMGVRRLPRIIETYLQEYESHNRKAQNKPPAR